MTFLMGITLWTLIVVGGIKAWTDGGTTPLRVKLRVAAAIALRHSVRPCCHPLAVCAFDVRLRFASEGHGDVHSRLVRMGCGCEAASCQKRGKRIKTGQHYRDDNRGRERL